MQSRQLARHLLEEHFGSTVATVGVQVLKGHRALKDLVRELPAFDEAMVKKALTVLHLHALVQAVERPDRNVDGSLRGIFYRGSVERMLQLDHLPRVLVATQARFGLIGLALVQVLLTYGRGRFNTLVDKALETDGVEDRDAVVSTLRDMIDQRFVRCYLGDYGEYMHDQEAHAQTKDEDAFALPGDLRKRRVRAVLSEGKRKKPKKKPKDEDEEERADVTTHLYMLNIPQYIRCFRNEWLCTYTKQKFGREFGQTVEYLLSMTVNYVGRQSGESATISAQRVHEEVAKILGLDDSFGHIEVSRMVKSHLTALHLRMPDIFLEDKVVDEIGGEEQAIIINHGAIVQLAQEHTLGEIVRDLLGEESLALFVLINQKKFIEQKNFQQASLLGNNKDTKSFLNNLLKHGFITLQEVPKGAERTPSRCVYLWASNYDGARRLVIERCEQAECNMICRIDEERKKIAVVEEELNRILGVDEKDRDKGLERSKGEEKAALKRGIRKMETTRYEISKQVCILRDMDEMVPASRFMHPVRRER